MWDRHGPRPGGTAYGAIRITLAETNTEAEVEYIADQLAAIVKDLRRK